MGIWAPLLPPCGVQHVDGQCRYSTPRCASGLPRGPWDSLGLARQVDIPVIASGGVKGLTDIDTLAQFAKDGIEGVITGRALYDGRLDLAAALRVAKRA